MKHLDPVISLRDAIDKYGGVQAHLAAALDVSRALVSQWVADGVEHVPGIHAYRLAAMHPDLVREAAA
jgi:hypothetical protein